MMRVDLTPDPRRRRGRRRDRTRTWLAVGAGYAALLATVGGIIHTRSTTPAAARHADAEHKLLSRRIAEAQAQSHALAAQIDSARWQVRASEAVSFHSAWGLLLRAIASARGEQILLQSIEVTRATPDSPTTAPRATPPPKPNAPKPAAVAKNAKPKPARGEGTAFLLRLGGLAMTNQEMLGFIRRLEGLGPIDHVHLKQSHAETLGAAMVTRFEIECTMADSTETPQ